MSQVIKQAVNDKITYEFTVGNLGVNTLTSVTAVSGTLTLTNISNNDTTFSITVDSTGSTGNHRVDVVLTLSNGNVENKCIKFVIGTICI